MFPLHIKRTLQVSDLEHTNELGVKIIEELCIEKTDDFIKLC